MAGYGVLGAVALAFAVAGASWAQGGSGTAGSAPGEIGREDVVPEALWDEIGACIQQARGPVELACLDRPDVSPDARRLARAVSEEAGLTGILTQVAETGEIDVAELFFPTMANTNWQMALVNGREGPLMAMDLSLRPQPANTANTRAVRAQHPRASESGRVQVAAVRPIPGGGQRFVLTDVVTDGCRACAPVALSVRYFDFHEGRRRGFLEIGWQPFLGDSLDVIERRLRRNAGVTPDDVRFIQYYLNLQGYEAGTVDGLAGPRTMAAFNALQRDHCLPENNRITGEVFAALTWPGVEAGYRPAPCAPRGASAPDMPFADGVYAATPDLCPPTTFEDIEPYGDAAYWMAMALEDGTWSWSSNECTILAATRRGSSLDLGLDCLSEGSPERRGLTLSHVSEAGFSYRGRTFRLCAADEPTEPSQDLRLGIYVDDPAKCRLDSLPFEDIHLTQRIVRQNGITWGQDGLCEERGADLQDGVTRFRGKCLGENDAVETTWRFRVLSDEAFVDLDMPMAVRPEPPRTFTRCPDGSRLSRTWSAWFEEPETSAETGEGDVDGPPRRGAYAEAPQICRDDGSMDFADDPDLTFSRPLLIDEGTMAWGPGFESGSRVQCGILDRRTRGAVTEFDLSCSGEGMTWRQTERVERLNGSEILFSGVRLAYCEPDARSEERAAAGAGPVRPRAFRAPEGYLWVQTHSRQTPEAAIALAREIDGPALRGPRVFSTESGWYAVTAGLFDTSAGDPAQLSEYLAEYGLPPDAFLTSGQTYLDAIPIEPGVAPAPPFVQARTRREAQVYLGQALEEEIYTIGPGATVIAWERMGDACALSVHEPEYVHCADLILPVALLPDGAPAAEQEQRNLGMRGANPVFGEGLAIDPDTGLLVDAETGAPIPGAWTQPDFAVAETEVQAALREMDATRTVADRVLAAHALFEVLASYRDLAVLQALYARNQDLFTALGMSGQAIETAKTAGLSGYSAFAGILGDLWLKAALADLLLDTGLVEDEMQARLWAETFSNGVAFDVPGQILDMTALLMEEALLLSEERRDLWQTARTQGADVLVSWREGRLARATLLDHFAFLEQLGEDLTGRLSVGSGRDLRNRLWILSQLGVMAVLEGPPGLPPQSLMVQGEVIDAVERMDPQNDLTLQRPQTYRAFADAVAIEFGLRGWEPFLQDGVEPTGEGAAVAFSRDASFENISPDYRTIALSDAALLSEKDGALSPIGIRINRGDEMFVEAIQWPYCMVNSAERMWVVCGALRLSGAPWGQME